MISRTGWGQVDLQTGGEVPPDVEQITSLATAWLAKAQLPSGEWADNQNDENPTDGRCAITGLATMALLSSGVDPNSGEYSKNVRAAIRYIILQQNPQSGYLPNTMYNHGFGMLALAEAYGATDEELMWSEAGPEAPAHRRRSIGEALKLAVRCAVTSQENNPYHAWRYAPEAQDADASVTGAILMGLLAARNAGIGVPDKSIDQGVEYIRSLTDKNGGVGYTNGFGGVSSGSNMAAIATLVAAVDKRKETPEYRLTAQFIVQNPDQTDPIHYHYNLYYMGQALFQSDVEAWSRWNKATALRLRRQQNADGSFDSPQHGKAYATAMSCLALALNYRFLPIYER